MSPLELENIHCTLGARQVLQGLSAAPIEPGQLFAVLGRNGVGKSTLLRCIAGLLACSAARMQIGECDLRTQSAAQRATVLRYLPQAAPGSLHLTVYESIQVALNARRRHVSAEAHERIAATATDLGLSHLLDHYLDELSGGQKQLVWLAQALVHRPAVLLLDEPLAALDPNYQHHVMKLIRRLAKEHGLIVMVVLHDLNMALRYAESAMVLHEGRVIAQGPVSKALTPDILARAFLVEARVAHCARGTPMIVIDDLLTL